MHAMRYSNVDTRLAQTGDTRVLQISGPTYALSTISIWLA